MGNSHSNFPFKLSSAEMALKIFEQELEMYNENFAFSPLSIQTAMSMVTLGSKGPSRIQLLNFIGRGSEKDLGGLMQSIAHVINSFHNLDSSITWQFHNAAFLQEDCELKEKYKMDLEEHLGAVVKSIDFENYPKAADFINGFVKAKTNDKIGDIVEGRELKGAVLILVNVLYFKGVWRDPFDARLTSKGDFFVKKGKTVKVDYMSKTDTVLLGKFEGRDVVALPYVGDRFSMFLIVPDKRGDRLHMKAHDIVKFLKSTTFQPKMVDLLLPKFEINTEMELKERFEKFGVHDIFDGSVSNLENIAECEGKDRPLFVSRIQHKVYMKVNEKGTEAAAVTGIHIQTKSRPVLEAYAHFDRPFTFLLKDEHTDTILFFGRIIDPTQ